MHYWTRDTVNALLRFATGQSYRIIRATPSGRISSDSVLEIVNRSRIGIDSPFIHLPDMLRPDETASRFGVTLKELRRWTHRTKKVAPHIRFNKSTVRFPASLFEKWLKENSRA